MATEPDIDPDEPIWRYISIAKYVDLLRTRSLYLPKASLLSDANEGKWVGHGVIMAERARWSALSEAADLLEDIVQKAADNDEALSLSQQYAITYRHRIPQVAFEVLGRTGQVYPHKRIEYLSKTLHAWRENARKSSERETEWRQQALVQRDATYISCWNRQSSMSFAMWQLYGGGIESVALKVRAGALNEIIKANEALLSDSGYTAQLWPVRYVDVHQEEEAFADQMMELLTNTVDTTVAQFTIKPQIYADEREVRLLVYPMRQPTDPVTDPHPDWSGFSLPLKDAQAPSSRVDAVVDAIHLHPAVSEGTMVFNIVEELHQRYGLKIPVIASPVQAME